MRIWLPDDVLLRSIHRHSEVRLDGVRLRGSLRSDFLALVFLCMASNNKTKKKKTNNKNNKKNEKEKKKKNKNNNNNNNNNNKQKKQRSKQISLLKGDSTII